MRIRAVLSFAVRVAITSEVTNELSCLRINNLNAVFGRDVDVAFVIQRLVDPVRAANTVRIRRDETHSMITIPGAATKAALRRLAQISIRQMAASDTV